MQDMVKLFIMLDNIDNSVFSSNSEIYIIKLKS